MSEIEMLRCKIVSLQELLGIDYMPTISQIREHKEFKIEHNVNKLGGLNKVSELLGIDLKRKTITYTENDILNKLKELVELDNLKRMPVSSEVLKFGGHPLHNGVTRKGGYRYFAEKLNLPLKDSETKLGQDYEYMIIDTLREKGFTVENMSTGHPYDILVNDNVKIDVKVSNLGYDKYKCKVHTFGLNKRNASCDIYICVTLDENKDIERILVIPSHHVKIVTLCIGKDSKYNKYIDKFEYIEEYSKFFNSIN